MMGDKEYINNEIQKMPNLDVIKNSYISKEKFIKMISELDFVCIEDCNIRFITGFVYDVNENKVNTRSYKIDIMKEGEK